MKVTYLNDRVRRMELSRPGTRNLPMLVINRAGSDSGSPRNLAKIEAARANGSILVVLEPDADDAANPQPDNHGELD